MKWHHLNSNLWLSSESVSFSCRILRGIFTQSKLNVSCPPMTDATESHLITLRAIFSLEPISGARRNEMLYSHRSSCSYILSKPVFKCSHFFWNFYEKDSSDHWIAVGHEIWWKHGTWWMPIRQLVSNNVIQKLPGRRDPPKHQHLSEGVFYCSQAWYHCKNSH